MVQLYIPNRVASAVKTLKKSVAIIKFIVNPGNQKKYIVGLATIFTVFIPIILLLSENWVVFYHGGFLPE